MTTDWHIRTCRDKREAIKIGTMDLQPSIEVRNVKFDIDAQVPRYWHGGRRSVTTFFDNLSIFFPVGERFFINSVKAYRHRVNDPKLAAEMRAFYQQEAIHSREHMRYNDHLKEQGYPVEEMERRIARILSRATSKTSKRHQLAATAALEHFTALMAYLLLNDRRTLEGAHPVLASLWRWHAAEENEHKAVAFDVYKATGGGYLERCGAMAIATVIFWIKVFDHQVRMMKVNGILFDASEWYALFKFLFIEPGGMQNVIRLYFHYYRPSFHPWELGDKDLLEAWKREIENSPAYNWVT